MLNSILPYRHGTAAGSSLSKGLHLYRVGILCLVLQACGYQYSGSQSLPTGVDTIAIHVVTNRSRQTGLEVTLTNALVNEFIQHRNDMVVDEARAQSVLSGTILSMETNVVSRSSERIVAQREVIITLSLTLKNKSGDIIWRDNYIRAKQSYSVSSDAITTESNRRRAIDRAVQRLAENSYNGIIHGF